MESLRSQLSLKLNSYTIPKLQQILRFCSLPSSKSTKSNNINALMLFLLDPINSSYIFQKFPKVLLEELMEVLPDPSVSCVCEGTEVSPTITCTVCTKKQHRKCIGNLIFMPQYVCISCQMRQLNPVDEILEYLVQPYRISNDSTIPTTKSFIFTHGLREEITRGSTRSEVQIRCLIIEKPGFAIAWPKQGQLSINQIPIKVFKESKTPGHKRKDIALDISFQLITGENEISLVKLNDINNYCLAVAKIKRHTEDEVKNMIIGNYIPKEESLKIVQSKFLSENDVESSSIRIKLVCPYALKLIKIPARGRDCLHLNCFDLENFISAQKYEHFSWKCPICRGPAYYIFVDKFFEEILGSLRELEDIESVQIFENGNYEPVLKINEVEDQGLKQKDARDVIPNKKLKIEEECKVIHEGMRDIIEID